MSIIKVLMKRDGMTREEAEQMVDEEMQCVRDMIGEGDFQGAEDYFGDVFGLEPDFLLDALI